MLLSGMQCHLVFVNVFVCVVTYLQYTLQTLANKLQCISVITNKRLWRVQYVEISENVFFLSFTYFRACVFFIKPPVTAAIYIYIYTTDNFLCLECLPVTSHHRKENYISLSHTSYYINPIQFHLPSKSIGVKVHYSKKPLHSFQGVCKAS